MRQTAMTLVAVSAVLATPAGAQQSVPFRNGIPVAPTGIEVPPLPREPVEYHTAEGQDIRVVVIARGLDHPWSIAFLPNGDLLVTERSGQLRRISGSETAADRLDPQPVDGVPEVRRAGLAGLMDVVLHPEFATNAFVYLSYSKPLDEATTSIAIARGRWDGRRLTGTEDIFLWGPGTGGNTRLAFGPDGMLYATSGGNDTAQDPASLGGKILRLRDDGSVPDDNPFVGIEGYRPEIYSLGHRTSIGLAFHPATGELWQSENGPNGGDEINIIRPGANYGWPLVSLGRTYPGPWQSNGFSREGFVDPVVYWTPSIATSGLAFYTGDRLEKWKGDVFVGGLRRGEVPGTGRVERILFNEHLEELRREELLTDLRQRIRDIRMGPDELLYVLTDEDDGAVLRIEPSGAAIAAAANAPPGRPAMSRVSDELIQHPEDADWLSWRRTLDGWGYSPLAQIDAANVGDLERVWSHPLGAGVQESTPIVHDGRMFVPNNGDYIQAFDAASGELLWEYRRHPEGEGSGTNRTIAIWGNLIINGSTDNAMYALDAATGELVWETQVLEPDLPARASSGPIIADGKVITGRQCQPAATHESCVITAHDAATGAEVWRTRTIPRPGEPGGDTWGDVPLEERWHVGTWMVPSYDPELELIYIGTSVTIPAPKFLLGGIDEQHLYHNSTLALDVDTGEIVWYYQHVIDHWDLDHPFERLLVDTVVAPAPDEVPWINPDISPGEVRKVITGVPGKTGLVYTLDRETGEFLWARPTIYQNVIDRIEPDTGHVVVNPDMIFRHGEHQLVVCPGTNGGKNWPAGAYSPRTNAMYVPMQNMCMDATMRTGERDPSLVYGFRNEYIATPGRTEIGAIYAISAETGETLWQHEQRAGVMSMVATGGGLVFGGDVAGMLTAYDERTGAVLWRVDLGAPVSGYPISYAVEGRQYIAAPTGPSLVAAASRRVAPDLPPAEGPAEIVVFALP